ncbi:hypothetical protein MUK42_08619 [Musa troglodytarum]|uniref:Uncharacterized protein n=1 Tax=Musa troglodytarum TaxID=320322 RepID=A0A9E7GWF4_9LILI|nr:hypothetical protein MUK42_08619 [Musa troglodytarum]
MLPAISILLPLLRTPWPPRPLALASPPPSPRQRLGQRGP